MKLTPSDATSQARAMLKAARVPATPARVVALAIDLLDVQDEGPDDFDLPIEQAAHTLTQRIGGLDNLESYLACLMAGPSGQGHAATHEKEPE